MNDIITRIENYISNEDGDKAYFLLKKIKKDFFYYYYLAEIYRIKGLMKKSLRYYIKAISKINRKIDKTKIFNAILKLASISRAFGDIKNTKKYINMAGKIFINREYLLENAMYFRMIGNFKKAIDIFDNLIDEYKKEKDYQALSYILWAKGGIFRLDGRFSLSIKAYRQSYYYASKINDSSLIVYSLFGLAGVLRVSGNINESNRIYKKAKSIIPDTDFFAKAYVYCGIANSLRQMGDVDNAIKNYKKSYILYKKVGDDLDLGLVLWGLGECYKRKNFLKKALSIFYKADRLFNKGFEPRGKILNLISISQTLYLMGNIKKAKKLYKIAIRESEKNNLNTYLEIFT